MRSFSFFYVLATITLYTLFISCADDAQNSTSWEDFVGTPIVVGEATKSYPNVDERMWVYFERFEKEGIRNGLNIDLAADGFTGSIENIPVSVASGACTYDANHTQHHITMDKDFWGSASVTQKELIMFHELGHCYLRRDHDNSKDSNGFCKSLMRADQYKCIDHYNADTRNKYVDELFSE